MIDPQTRHNIRKIREIKGYSQDYMAIELEVSSKSYSRIECGKTGLSISRLKKLLRFWVYQQEKSLILIRKIFF